MNQIVPRSETVPEDLRFRNAVGVPKEVVRAVQRELGRGLVVAARLEAAAYATRTALINTALLSHEEESCIQLAPLGEARYKAIVDAYAMYAVGQISKL